MMCLAPAKLKPSSQHEAPRDDEETRDGEKMERAASAGAFEIMHGLHKYDTHRTQSADSEQGRAAANTRSLTELDIKNLLARDTKLWFKVTASRNADLVLIRVDGIAVENAAIPQIDSGRTCARENQ